MGCASRTPAGTPLQDGYQTIITFASNPAVKLWEKTVTPPGEEGGDKIDTTTMHNCKKRTFAPRSLSETTNPSFTAAYDPAVRDEIDELINKKDQVSIEYPDGSTDTLWAALKSFVPNANEEGVQPTAECEINALNSDSNDSEADVVHAPPA